MWLAVEDAFLPKWTQEIHEEWIKNALIDDAKKNDPPRLDRTKLERTRDLMNRHAAQSLVIDYELRIPLLTLPDSNDRHILAAAIESGASWIVTFNDRHFPSSTLSSFGIEAIKPDRFLCMLFDADPTAFLRAMHALLASLRNPPITQEQLYQSWQKLGLTRLAQKVQDCTF